MTATFKIGIDLGTTFSACGIYKSDRIEIITENGGNHVLESVIFPDIKQKKIIVGAGCKYDVNKSKQVVYDSKRFIGMKYDSKQFQIDLQRWQFKDRVKNINGIPMVETDYWNKEGKKLWTAEEISSAILKEIHDRCCICIGVDINTTLEAVITVPAYFTCTKREKTRIAAENANLRVIQIINEPSAAALAYAHQVIQQNAKSDEYKYILVYDFGGGTFDVSIIKLLLNYEHPEIDVIATEGDSHLGGEDIDEAMVEFYKKRYKKEMKKEMNEKNIIKCRTRCEEAKKILTDGKSTSANVELDIFEDNDIDVEISLAEFNDIIEELIERTIYLTKKVYKEVEHKIPKLDYIILVGGSSAISSIRPKLEKEFPDTEIMSDIGAQEAVAYGATILANEKRFMNMKFKDIITKNIYSKFYDVENDKDKYYCIIKKNTPLDEVDESFTVVNYMDNQEVMDADLYEGDIDKDEINLIGFERIPITKRKQGECRVDFHVTCDVSGIYHIKTNEIMDDGSFITRNITL